MPDESHQKQLPLLPLPDTTEERLRVLGGASNNLYRVLANEPALLNAWIEFAWTLRRDCEVDQSLRQLVILKVAEVAKSDYQWRNQVLRARQIGVPQKKVDDLQDWQTSDAYDERERAALALVEDMEHRSTSHSAIARIGSCFNSAEQIDLVLTTAFQYMAAQVLDVLCVPVDE